METRAPDASEPESSPVYVRLGMTKGALVAFLVVLAAGIAGFLRVEQLARDNERLGKQNRANVVRVQAQARKLEDQEKQVLTALREVCRQGDVVAGLTKPIVDLLEFDVRMNTIPEVALPVYQNALSVFKGYQQVLKEQPGCRQITRP